MSFHMLPIATGGTRIGRIATVRTQRLARDRPATAIASATPSTISTATDATTKTSVLTTAGRSTSSLASAAKLRNGVNVQTSAPFANVIVDTLIRARFSSG